MKQPGMVVYSGKGASHSWTWLASLFERHGIGKVRFLDAAGMADELDKHPHGVVISGGDGHSIAEALADSGFSALREFVREGGLYIGICAGAYLALPSSIEPFRRFNLSSTKIENIDDSRSGRRESPRLSTSYGSCSIIHPARGDLTLTGPDRTITAPLYGGPIFKEPGKDSVLLRYSGFTEDAELQMDRIRAEAIVLGRPAAILCEHGSGSLLLLGPHLEHPRHLEANRLFLRLAGLSHGPALNPPSQVCDAGLARSAADLKVAILGLENRSFIVGSKLWDGSRFMELLAAVERYGGSVDWDTSERISKSLRILAEELRLSKDDTMLDADAGPELLVESARICADSHFRKLRKSR